jgi:hypothetical protein
MPNFNERFYNTIVVVATIASATVAAWHNVINSATYAAIVTAALGIGGIVHKNGNGKPPPVQ